MLNHNKNLAIHLFINPAAGRGAGKKLAPKIREFLLSNGLTFNTTLSRGPGDLCELINKACLEGCQTILIIGGDGSIYEAVNGIMLAEKTLYGSIEKPSSTALGIIPVGTGNDFIKAANIAPDWQKACMQILKATSQLVDVAILKTANGQEKYFINNIGSGFDAGAGITASHIPLLRGKAVYVAALLWHLIKGIPNPEIKVQTENFHFKGSTTLVAVSNGTCYGGSFKITPQASITDGLLDAVIAPPVGRFGAIKLVFQLLSGTHLKNPSVTHVQCKEFSLSSATPIPVMADGEIIETACTEYSVELLEGKLRLLV